MKPTSLVVALALAAAPVAATASPQQAQGPTIPEPRYVPEVRPSVPAGLYSVERDAWSRGLTEAASSRHSPRRLARADRAAKLIEEGKCGEAVALAREARDNRLVESIQNVCESRGLSR